MVAHVVLFDLRRDLSAGERQRFAEAFTRALRDMPSVRHARVGRRASIGAAYESTSDGFSYLAVIEFDDEAGLRSYLDHSAHTELGALFRSCTARAVVNDFTLAGDNVALALATWSTED